MRSSVRRVGSGCGSDFCHSGILYSELLVDTLVVFKALVLVFDCLPPCPQCRLNSADPLVLFTEKNNSSKTFKYLFMVGFIPTKMTRMRLLSFPACSVPAAVLCCLTTARQK